MLQIPALTHPNSHFTCFLRLSQLIRLIFRFKPMFAVRHVATYTADVRRRVRAPVSGSILAKQPLGCSSSPNTTVSRQGLHSTRANAPFPLPLAIIKNLMEWSIPLSQSSSLEKSVYEIDEGGSDSERYTRARDFSQIFNSSPPNHTVRPSPFNPLLETILSPHLPLHHAPAFPSAGKRQSRALHTELPTTAHPNAVCSSSAYSSILSSSSSSDVNHLSSTFSTSPEFFDLRVPHTPA